MQVSNNRIIDVHAHYGRTQPQELGMKQGFDSTIQTLLNNPLSGGEKIEKILVSSADGLIDSKNYDEFVSNRTIISACNNEPRMIPIALCQPHKGSVRNIEKLFKENPNRFVGLKFHPNCHDIPVADERYIPYMEFAQKKNLPCLFHCALAEKDKINHSSPEEIYKLAKHTPKTPVILAHLATGGSDEHKQAINTIYNSILKNDATLYADISWVNIDDKTTPDIIELIKKLKNHPNGDYTNRILFGTDAPIARFSENNGLKSYSDYVTKIKNSIKNDSELAKDADNLIDKIFYRNAEELFFTKKNTKKLLTMKNLGLIGLVTICSGIIAHQIIKNKTARTNTKNQSHQMTTRNLSLKDISVNKLMIKA